MAEGKKVCLDCGKVETQSCPDEEERTLIWGLCDECYKRWLKRDPELTRWAFEEGSEEEKG